MAFRSLPSRVKLLGWLLAVMLALAAVWLAFDLARTPLGPATIRLALTLTLALGVLELLLFRLWALAGLDYWVERDAVRIHWAGDVIVIPMGEIRRWEGADSERKASVQWWRWPHHWVRPISPAPNAIAGYATRSPAECVLLATGRATYYLSPVEPEAFLAALQERKALGAARRLGEGVERAAWRQHWLFHHRLPALLLGLGLLCGAGLLAYTIWHYPALPAEIALHFDATDTPDRIGPRRALFLLPAITLLIWFFNAWIGFALYERQRPAAAMLWGSALALQIAALVVVRNLLALAGV